MQVQTFAEVRATEGIKVTPASHFFFSGVGHPRVNLNDGQPQVLNARNGKGASIDGRVRGTVKVTSIMGAPGWYSLRSVGKGGNGRTVYVKGTSTVVVDGEESTLADFYSRTLRGALVDDLVDSILSRLGL